MNAEEIRCSVCGRSTLLDCVDLERVEGTAEFHCRAHMSEEERKRHDQFWNTFKDQIKSWNDNTK